MTAGTLWIEMTIAGSVYVASLFFFVMAWSHPSLNLESLATRLHDFLAYIAVAIVGLSYIFGFVAHRVIQVASQRLAFVEKWRLTKGILKVFDFVALSGDIGKRMHEEMIVWKMDPQRIYREIDFQFAQVALLRSLLVSAPFLAFSIHYWCVTAEHHRPIFSVAFNIRSWYVTAENHPAASIGFLIFYVALLLAFRRQSIQYDTIRNDAVAVGRRHEGCLVPILSPNSGPSGTAVRIRGIDFGMEQGDSKIFFVHGTLNTTVDVTPKIWEPTRILVSVPESVSNVEAEGNFIIKIFGASDGVQFEQRFVCPFSVTK